MTVDSKLVPAHCIGGGLKHWADQAALDLIEWEKDIKKSFDKNGYVRVYSPHMAKKPLGELYADWLPPMVKTVIAKDGEYPEIEAECEQYDFLTPAVLHHAVMLGTYPASYKDLPIRYWEVGQSYTPTPEGVTNDICLTVTVMCEPDHMDLELRLSKAILEAAALRIGTPRPLKVVGRHSKAGLAPPGQLLYVTADNRKIEAGLVTTCYRYAWSEKPEEAAVIVNHTIDAIDHVLAQIQEVAGPNDRACLVCDRVLPQMDMPEYGKGIPAVYDATVWRTTGNFGSGVYDPYKVDEHLEAVICDKCLVAKRASIMRVVFPHVKPLVGKAEPFDPTRINHE